VGKSHCRLNLHGVNKGFEFGEFMNEKASLGLIIASGNMGPYISQDIQSANTFLSNDGGVTWSMIEEIPVISQTADYGNSFV
jgi:hypothetical protein